MSYASSPRSVVRTHTLVRVLYLVAPRRAESHRKSMSYTVVHTTRSRWPFAMEVLGVRNPDLREARVSHFFEPQLSTFWESPGFTVSGLLFNIAKINIVSFFFFSEVGNVKTIPNPIFKYTRTFHCRDVSG